MAMATMVRRAAATQSVGEPPARILVNGVEEIFRCSEEPDDERACAERLKVLRQKLLPQLLAESEQKDRRRDRRDVTLQPKVVGHAPAPRPRLQCNCLLFTVNHEGSARI